MSLTLEQKRERIIDKCGSGECWKCPIEKKEGAWCETRTILELPDSLVDEYYNLMFPNEKANNSKVDHPKHYNREGAMECIDEMILVFGVEAVKNFCLCNWLKYRYRAAEKNGFTDLQKSDWYLMKYKELCQ